MSNYVPGTRARQYVQQKVNFTNSSGSFYAVHSYSLRQYVVYSYGPHWPLFIYSAITKTWYENTDRYGTTTSKHHGQAHPLTDTIGLCCADMKLLDQHGPMALTKHRLTA